jgi:hypothetical protein
MPGGYHAGYVRVGARVAVGFAVLYSSEILPA